MRYAKTFFAALVLTLVAAAAAAVFKPAQAVENRSTSAVCDGFGYCYMVIDSQGNHVV